MRTTERTRRRARGASLDIDLARRAERKLNRYHMDLNGVLALIIDAHGLPDLRNATPDIPARRADRQLAAIRATAGRWDDGRDAAEIIAEIEGARTMGREVDLNLP